jgi:hypothetical protein
VAGSQYLPETDQYRFEVSASLGLRVVRGLELSLSAGWTGIRDQRYLAKRGATEQEILLYRRALATDYQYWTSISLSYTFGSIYNNIVNPRLGAWRRTR